MKNFQLNSKKLKSEKGSITLFVLTTMLFLLGVLIISYMGVRGKVIEQDKKIKQIQEEYNTVDINQQYSQTLENLDLDLQLNLYTLNGEYHSADKWTNQNLKAQVVWPENALDADKEFYIGEDKLGIDEIDETVIEEYKEITATYKTKTKSVIAKIDKETPTVFISPNDNRIIITGATGVIETTITVKENLNGSGIKEVKYAWSENETGPAEEEYQKIEISNSPKQIVEQISTEKPIGIYYLYIAVVDNAGNDKVEFAKYEIADSLPPTVTMKYADANGEEYKGAWTNQNIYTEITTNELEFIVKNYEYSTDNITYAEIGAEKTGDITFYEYAINNSTATYKIQDEADYSMYFRDLYKDGSHGSVTQEYKVRIDKTAPTASLNYEYASQEQAKIVVSDIVESASGIKGYYMSAEETEPTAETTWVEATGETINIENLSINTNYYIWLIDKAGNISEKYSVEIKSPNYSVDDKIYVETLEQAISNVNDNSNIKLLSDYEDASVATIDKNITFDVQTYTLTRTQVITINSGKTVTITGSGTITSATENHTIQNAGTLIVNMEGKIESTVASASYNAILNTGTLTIENGTISGYYKGISNNDTAAIINVKAGTIESIYANNNAYAIRNYKGTLNINGGDIKGYYGIFDDATVNKVNIYEGTIIGTGAWGIRGGGTIVVNGGSIKGNTDGICQNHGILTVNGGTIEGDNAVYQNSTAIVKILGGEIKGTTNGIYGTATNRITIGDSNSEVNTKTPIVSGGLYGICMKNTTHSYNFNNGIIMGDNTIPYTEKVVPRDGYMIYTYYDYDAKKYVSILNKAVDNITIEQNPTEWTNQDVEIQVRYPVVEGATLQFSEDGENWKEVNNGYITKISENKKVYARMIDGSGIILQSAEHDNTNIDKIAPTLSINPETTKYIIYDQESTNVDINTTVTIAEEGGSGLNTSKYGWSTSREEEPKEWTDFSSGDTIIKTKCEVGTYYLWFDLSDGAGNTSDINVIKYIVELQEAIAKIGDNYYYTIQEAIDAAGTTASTVEIIRDTNEVIVIQEGQDIIIDLQGYVIGSSSSEQAVITNNGTLQIIDSKESKTCKIENLVGTAIINNGTLTLGDNSTSIEDGTPIISGKKVGISNNSTLNYYDGTIKGKIAIQGEVQATPESYGPVGVYENGITTVNLRVVSDYVARIEWTYYTTLQDAFNACEAKENNEEQTTVVMLKDIVLDSSATIARGQNVRLNLNGYTLTSSNGSVINNNGKLDITDLSEEQTGNIFSSVEGSVYTNYKLINNQGELTVSGGNIITENSYNYPIYSENGKVYINGGIISSDASRGNTYGVYNASIGEVNVTDGTISATNYGVYNASTGTINVNGGTINSSSQGIYNASTGTINVTGGIISVTNYGVHNASTGTINVTGGTISVPERYGIYNISTGEVNITSGEINSKVGIYNTGTINVTGGTVNTTGYNSRGIENMETGTINIAGGTISNIANSITGAYGVYNRGGQVNITGGTVSANLNNKMTNSQTIYGVYNESSGIINIAGGMVSAKVSIAGYKSYGVYNASTGMVNIGSKSDSILSNTNPIIISDNVNVNADSHAVGNILGTLNFYDGILKSTGYIVYGGINEIEDNYEVKEEEADGYKIMYLVPENKENYIIENTKTGKQYINIQEAINEVTVDDYELKVLQDMHLLTEMVIPENTNLKLDLNGKTITNNYFNICNYGDLEITDSVSEGEIINNKTVLCNLKQGNIDITGGTLNSSTTNNTNADPIYAIYNMSTGRININGGTISSSTINSADLYAIYNASTGTINIEEGIVSSSNSRINYSKSYAIYNASTGTINVTGGTVSSSSLGMNFGTSNGIYNASTGTINVTGGRISSNSVKANPSYGIYNAKAGTLNIMGGSISSTGNNEKVHGVSNASTGIINLGTKGDGVVSNTEPHIIGEYTGTSTSYAGYGIYNVSGTFNFYDGKIEGSTRAIPEDNFISEIEDNTTPLYENENTLLTLSTGITDVAKIGDVTYSSLQEAINVAGTDETRIELLRGIQYTSQDMALEIAENQNIILDLKGSSIASAIEDAIITNRGTLKITDSSEGAKGKITSTYEMTIYNTESATLELEKGTITRNVAKNNVLYNEGTVNVTGGIVSQPGDSGYSIYNAQNAVLNISDGSISGGTKGIYNMGKTDISGGTIENGITNEQNGILKIQDGTITGEIINRATLEMTGGNIEVYSERNSNGEIIDKTPKYGIYSTSGTVTIGIKDGEINGIPTISATTSGIYCASTLNVYDGIIKGETSAINGTITEKEESSEVAIAIEEEFETLRLIKVDSPLAQVGENQYYSLKEAIDSISSEGTVTILREGIVADTINIEETQDITLDLNGNTLKMYTRIQNAGTLNITDTSTEKTGVMTSYKDSPIYNSGNLTLTEGTISGNSYGIYNKTNGTTNIEGGNLTQNTYGIYAVDGVVNVNAGTISENTYGTIAYGKNAIVNIEEGTITNNEYGVYNANGTTNITGGTINGNTHEVYNGGVGTINIASGSIITTNVTAIENASSGTIVIGTEDGNVITDSPVIQAEEYGITNSGNGTIKFYDGTIKGRKGGLSGVYLYTESGYVVKTEYIDEYYSDILTPSGTISTVAKIGSIEYTNLQSAINACTSEEAITITLVNSINTNEVFSIEEGQNVIIDLNGKGIISATVKNIIENAGNLTIIDSSSGQTGKITNSYDVTINNLGTLTLGQDDGTVSTTCPEISGTTYGIKNTGTFNFYDGIIKASVAVDGTINSRATGYVISKTVVDAVEQVVLSK